MEARDEEAGDALCQFSPPPDVPSTSLHPNLSADGRSFLLLQTPSWYSVNMGTGITSILLYNMPYQFSGLKNVSQSLSSTGSLLKLTPSPLRQIGNVVFVLNIVLFLFFTGVTLARYILWPSLWRSMLHHPAQSLFLGTCPMGLSTIVNMFAFSVAPAWGGGWVTFTWVLWWINVVIALLVSLGVPYQMVRSPSLLLLFYSYSPALFLSGTDSLRNFSLRFLSVHQPEARHRGHDGRLASPHCLYHRRCCLGRNRRRDTPSSSRSVCSPLFLIVCDPLLTSFNVSPLLIPPLTSLTVVVSYILWGTGFPVAVLIMAIYYSRLTFHKIPARAQIISTFLPLGPTGQGAFGLLQLGSVVRNLGSEGGGGIVSGGLTAEEGRMISLAVYGGTMP